MKAHNVDDESSFRNAVEEEYDKTAPDLTKTLNIVVIGKVSAGKSSLINALLQRGRENPLAKVGATSGVTKKLHVFRLDDHVCIIDSPGLDDIRDENSDVTRDFLEAVDVGILVVTGSVDSSQKKHADALRAECKCVFVVLNKTDEWDDLEVDALEKVMAQWKRELSVETIYPTCTKGFDPKTREGVLPDVRGVDHLRSAVETFVEGEGKALLLARQMGEKRSYAMKLIAAALIAVGGQALLPGSAIYITATQAAAIVGLYYLYTGRVLSKSNALGLIPLFAAETVGTTLFLWAKSFMPPTGLLDLAAALVAVSVTAAMLVSVSSLLASGAELHEEAALRSRFVALRARLKGSVSGASLAEIKSAAFWKKILHDMMYS